MTDLEAFDKIMNLAYNFRRRSFYNERGKQPEYLLISYNVMAALQRSQKFFHMFSQRKGFIYFQDMIVSTLPGENNDFVDVA